MIKGAAKRAAKEVEQAEKPGVCPKILNVQNTFKTFKMFKTYKICNIGK